MQCSNKMESFCMICWFLQFIDLKFIFHELVIHSIFNKIMTKKILTAELNLFLFEQTIKRVELVFFTPWIMFFMLIPWQLHKFRDFFFCFENKNNSLPCWWFKFWAELTNYCEHFPQTLIGIKKHKNAFIERWKSM